MSKLLPQKSIRLVEFNRYRLKSCDFASSHFRYLTVVNEWETRLYAHGVVVFDKLGKNISNYEDKKLYEKSRYIWIDSEKGPITSKHLVDTIHKMCMESPDKEVYLELAINDKKDQLFNSTSLSKTITYVLHYLGDEKLNRKTLHVFELYTIDNVKSFHSLSQLWELKYPSDEGYVPLWYEEMFGK